MLARRKLPTEYCHWNRKWQAPFGRLPQFGHIMPNSRFNVRRRGPFGWQINNSTREFEYPWAYHAIARRGKGLSIVEIGGSLAGLQFVLAKEGHHVVNVDPGLKAGGLGWSLDEKLHARLCRCLDAPVQLIPNSLIEAGLKPASVDVLLCISALEHFSDDDLHSTAEELPRLLKPGGVVVMTVDLFLDTSPFCDRPSNRFGRNIDLKAFLQSASLQLVEGDPVELYGFDEFSTNNVLRSLAEYHVGRGYPCLAQCLTATLN